MKTENKVPYIFLIVIATAWLFALASTMADAADADDKTPPATPAAAPAPAKPGDAKTEDSEVDISDVQNQYWKAHDKDFEVVQNKQFTKTHRVEFTPLFGFYQSSNFEDTKVLGGSLAYHFTDIWGIEAMGYKMFNSPSTALTTFQQNYNATVQFNSEKYFVGGSLLFTPIYGKFSLFGKKISHFEVYLAPGAGITQTINPRFTTKLGIGEKFWLSPHWNIRVEYDWTRYTDKTITTQGATAIQNGGPGYSMDTVNDQNLLFGLSYLFN